MVNKRRFLSLSYSATKGEGRLASPLLSSLFTFISVHGSVHRPRSVYSIFFLFFFFFLPSIFLLSKCFSQAQCSYKGSTLVGVIFFFFT